MAHYDFFQNKECEYYPCHPGANPETFSCLFCYCPLYALGDRCGGNFRKTRKLVRKTLRRAEISKKYLFFIIFNAAARVI